MNRPFAFGDMVVSKLYRVGNIKFLNDKNGNFVADFKGAKYVFVPSGEVSHPATMDWVMDITCIRTPRKGCKEARDIVAMLGWERKKYLSEIRKHWNNENVFGVLYWEKRKEGLFNKHSSFIRLEKAKSMLGANNA